MLEKIKELTKDYAGIYNLSTDKFKKDKAYIDGVYNNKGDRWAEQYKTIKDNYDNLIKQAKESAIEETKTIFAEITKKLKDKIVEGVSPEVVSELELLKMTKVTKEDIHAYLEKYNNSYLVCKVLKELAEERKIDVNVITLQDKMKGVEELQTMVIDFYNSYTGPLKSYKCELILNGAIIDGLDKRLQLKYFI